MNTRIVLGRLGKTDKHEGINDMYAMHSPDLTSNTGRTTSHYHKVQHMLEQQFSPISATNTTVDKDKSQGC